jgi:hypothetical protein
VGDDDVAGLEARDVAAHPENLADRGVAGVDLAPARLGDGISADRIRLGRGSLLLWWRGRLSMAVTGEAN